MIGPKRKDFLNLSYLLSLRMDRKLYPTVLNWFFPKIQQTWGKALIYSYTCVSTYVNYIVALRAKLWKFEK